MTTKYTISIQLPSCYNNGKSFTAKLEHVPCVHLDEISLYEMQAKTATMIVEPYCLQAAAVAHHVYDTIPKKYHDLAEVYPGCQICAGQRGNWVILNGFGGQLFNVQYIGEKGSFIFSNDSKIPNFVGLVDPDDCLQPGDRGLAFRHRGKWFVMRLTPKKQKQQFPECRAMVVGGNALPDVIKMLNRQVSPVMPPKEPTVDKDEYSLPRDVYPDFPTYIFPKISYFYRPIVVDWNIFAISHINFSNLNTIKLPRLPDGLGYGILLKPCSSARQAWYEGIEDAIESGDIAYNADNERTLEYKRASYFLQQNIPIAAVVNKNILNIYFLDAERAGVLYDLDPNIYYTKNKILNSNISKTAKSLFLYELYEKYISFYKDGKPIDAFVFGKSKLLTQQFITVTDLQYDKYEGRLRLHLSIVNWKNGNKTPFFIEPYLPCVVKINPIIFNMSSRKLSEEKELLITKPQSATANANLTTQYKLVYLWNTTDTTLTFKDNVLIDHEPIPYSDQQGQIRPVYKIINVTNAHRRNRIDFIPTVYAM